MRFFSVQDGYALKGMRFFSVYEESRGINDDEIIRKAFIENWILITSDKDFGEKIYRENRLHQGILLPRLAEQNSVNKIEMLRQLLANYAQQLSENFIVVTEKQVRIARTKI